LAGTMVTGADGIAVSEPLRKGRYIVREHGETAGYVFEEITLDATVKSDETTELFVTNCPVIVKLRLYKRDADEYDGDNPNASANARASNDLPEPADISTPTTRGDGVLTSAEFQVLAGEDITAADSLSPLPVKEEERPSLEKKIGKTTYRVIIDFSATSSETMNDKIKRMLRNEIQRM